MVEFHHSVSGRSECMIDRAFRPLTKVRSKTRQAVYDLSVFAKDERLGNRHARVVAIGNVEQSEHIAWRKSYAIVHGKLLYEHFHAPAFHLWVFHRQADDFDALVFELIVQCNQVGNFPPAGAAPSRPKVDQHDFVIANQITEFDAIAFQHRQIDAVNTLIQFSAQIGRRTIGSFAWLL